MGLHLVSSNQVELLQSKLAEFVQAYPLDSPFIAETVLIPSMPMRRWLGLQLAESAGIHCNVDYALPASWIWQLVSGSSHQTDPLARDSMVWLLFGALPVLLDTPSFSPLKAYLNDDSEGVKRWQLCVRIADVFDRYQYYRPQMIRQWSAGDGDGWQPLLWRALLATVGVHNHRVALMDRWLANAITAPPSRISLFCIASLPPLLLQLLQRVAQHSDVYLYYLTPTNSYWADLKTEKYRAKQRLKNSEAAIYYETGHALLASWGQQGQVYQDMLLNNDSLQALECEVYHEVWPETLLGNLQRDMFLLQSQHDGVAVDDSLEIHICHSAQRECQVLHDALLRRLQQDSSLKPEDVLVMVPEISRYAPYITAVFAKERSGNTFIPWNLSDISIADIHPLIGAFLQLLQLPSSRFAFSEVVSLLDVPEICARFMLDRGQVVRLRALLETLQVRWGVDEKHRASMGLPATIENSWKQAEQRFLAGYAMGEGGVWQDIAPMAVDGNDVEMMTRFWSLFERLNHWRKQLRRPRTARVWQLDLTMMLDDLFCECGEDGFHLQHIRDVLADLAQQAEDNQLSTDLVGDWLDNQLSQQDAPDHYFSGGVSFCGMRPMRSLPFRIICLLGMQDAAFPRREHPVGFDLMTDHWQAGDPCKGEIDRYLLLETLLCTRDALHISYTGRSIRDNSECQPSVLVDELRDDLVRCYGEEVVKAMTYLHPMQPFAADNFMGAAYDEYWLKLANSVTKTTTTNVPQQAWPQAVLTAIEQPQEISLARLIQFVKHPVKFFVNHSLNIYLDQLDGVGDDEPFVLDGLQRWHVRDCLLQGRVQQENDTHKRLQSEGVLPHGQFANQVLMEEMEKLEPLLEVVDSLSYGSATPQWVDLFCPTACSTGGASGQVRVCGKIQHYYPKQGLLYLSPSKLAGRHLLAMWIEHLALCAAGGLVQDEVSRMVYVDETVVFPPLSCGDALQQLTVFTDAYWQGVQQPLPIFPSASWAYANSNINSGDSKKASKAALKGWQDSWRATGDRYDPYISLMMRGVTETPIDEPDFSRWAQQWYYPLLQAK